jgi:hypothetical protein
VKRRTALSVLLALGLLLPLTHLELACDGGPCLLRVSGRPVDVRGHLDQWWTQLTRDCRAVQGIGADAPAHAQVLAQLKAHSPPDSASARLLVLQQQGPWWLAQAQFDTLRDAVVLLHEVDGRWQVMPTGIFSGGPTAPWMAEPLVRRYLRERVPQAPRALIDCWSPMPGWDALGERPIGERQGR